MSTKIRLNADELIICSVIQRNRQLLSSYQPPDALNKPAQVLLERRPCTASSSAAMHSAGQLTESEGVGLYFAGR